MKTGKEIIIGVAEFTPLIYKKGDSYEGFEIDLWNKISAELGIENKYKEYSFEKLLDATKKGDVGVAMAGITRNQQREEVMDFSHRTFDSGLVALVLRTKSFAGGALLRQFFSKQTAQIISFLLLFIFIAANAIWFVERGESVNALYLPGLADSLWWAIVTVSTVGYGDIYPATPLGRLVGSVIILSGLAVFGVYIGHISSLLTFEKMRSSVLKPSDLSNKDVATRKGATSVHVLTQLGARVTEVDQIVQAYDLLDKKSVDAVVFDAPVLLNIIKEDTSNKYEIAGPVFEKQTYGFAFPEGSELREGVNRILLRMRESGEYDELYNKWFQK